MLLEWDARRQRVPDFCATRQVEAATVISELTPEAPTLKSPKGPDTSLMIWPFVGRPSTPTADWHPVLALPASNQFSGFAVEVFSIALGISVDLVDKAIAMIGRGVEGIKFQRHGAGVGDVVIDAGRDEYRKADLNRRPGAIQYGLARTFFNMEKLANLVNLGADVFLGFQRHEDKLRVFGRVKHLAKLVVFDGETFNILYKAFHHNSFSMALGDLSQAKK